MLTLPTRPNGEGIETPDEGGAVVDRPGRSSDAP